MPTRSSRTPYWSGIVPGVKDGDAYGSRLTPGRLSRRLLMESSEQRPAEVDALAERRAG
jgi:hypothetical protein